MFKLVQAMLGVRLNKKLLALIVVAVVLAVGGFLFWRQTQVKPPKSGLQPQIAREDEKGEFEESIKELDQNKPADSAAAKDKYNFHFARANNLSALGQQKEAIEEFKKAEATGHKLNYEFYISLGLAYELDGNNAEAKKAYEEAIIKVNADTMLTAESKEARINGININLARVQ